ncbi:hypothetical protein C4577_05510 [Candidatus Parcubacteria bacterium]|nr:MAG: hypothetical protein C4577_05510 [Candidatus Parcubacteria bacterium]
MTTYESQNRPKPGQFSLGYDLRLRNDVARFIAQDAKNSPFEVKGGGFLSTFKTGIDNYLYLIWYKGGLIKERAGIVYTIYENELEIPNSQKIIYHNKFIYVTKNERN